ncbi:MAG: GNAT family N-acetyltransferase [Steroidobacteraceae bacterium]
MTTVQGVPLRVVRSRRAPSGRTGAVSARAITLRTGTPADAGAIHGLILDHLQEGHLLPRELDEIVNRATRFVVAVHKGEVVACGELAQLSSSVAEIRSLVVSRSMRSVGLSRRLVNELIQRATVAGFYRLCAFTHSPAYFVHLGFSIVPHTWLPEKIVTDCHSCVHFRQCGQYAVMHDLARQRDACVPLAALHG